MSGFSFVLSASAGASVPRFFATFTLHRALAHSRCMGDPVYFKCQHCGLPYVAKTAPRSNLHSGTIECVDCHKLAYEWAGFYSLFDWLPARMGWPTTGTKQ